MSFALNLNEVLFVGTIHNDPKIFELKDEKHTRICEFILSVRRPRTNHNDFFRCDAMNEVADFIMKYFRKGSPIAVHCYANTKSWVDQPTGKRIYGVVFAIRRIDFAVAQNYEEQEKAADNYSSFATTEEMGDNDIGIVSPKANTKDNTPEIPDDIPF